jgi:hypothetical protein
MRTNRFLRRATLFLLIGAVPVGAIVWLLATPGWGVFTTITALLVAATIYAVTPPPLQSSPGKPDPNDLSTSPILGGRGQMEADRLWARPLRSDSDRHR